jgi:hypothetical protein
MNRSVTRAFVLLVAPVMAAQPSPSAAQFRELVERLPAGANAIVVINAEKMFASPLAVKEGWQQNYEKTHAAAPMLLPPKALQFVMASKLDLEFMTPKWEVAVMRLSTNPMVDQVAKRIKGTIDRLGGAEAVEGPQGGFIVKFAPSIFGMITRGDRQAASRWVEFARTSTSITISPYLKEAAGYAENAGTEIILAFDLNNAVRAQDVRVVLGEITALKETQVDLDQLSTLLGGVRGLTLGVTLGERAFGALKVDFASDASILDGVSKALLLEMLGEAGAMIDDFNEWEETVKGNRIEIRGYLSEGGLRRIFSVLEIDGSKVAAEPHGDEDVPKATDDKETIAYTSRQYFQAVEKYLRDLRLKKGAKSYGQYGLWFDKYARKIDRLPILNVDPELVDFGQNMANGLRDATSAIQGVGIRSAAQEAQIYNQSYTRGAYSGFGPVNRVGGWGWRVYGGYGGYFEHYTNPVQSQRRAVRAQERAKGSAQARDIMKQIDMEASKMRRTMTDRYQIEF